ncbi:MAG: ATP-dependent sacrificial sulfur transferase LarE [Nitrosopumilaceae archaeon]
MKRIDELIHWFDDRGKVLIALSGGVDSSLVAYASYRSVGNSSIAVTADYKTLARDELESAKKVCSEIGIKHVIINYNELENSDFVKNDKNRCFHCRTELSERLRKISAEEGADLVVDGTNLDDLIDYRPGIQAMRDSGVRSPLVELEFRKDEIRKEAKKVGLSVYDRPSNSCLASRIPWGQTITAEKLARIEVGEVLVKQIFGVKQARVRDLDGVAKIEVGAEELGLVSDKAKISQINERLKQVGFTSVVIDPEGYKPGKINVITY